MTQLTNYQQSPAIAAYQSKSCKAMTDAELFPIITQQAQKVCAFSGQALPDNSTVFAALVAETLRQQGCTIDQFKEAVKIGMQTTEIYSASAPHTYIKWVKQYLESVRQEIMNHNARQTPVKTYSEDEKMALIREGVLTCYDNFKATGYIQDAGDAVYLYLEGKGVIDIPVEVKKTLFENAKEKAIELIKMKQVESDRHTARALQSIIRAAMDGEEVDEVRKEQRKICRTNILKDLFSEMTREELKDAI